MSSTNCGIRWAFALDSEYVIDGVDGGAEQWKSNDRQSRSGVLVSHVDLWIRFLDLLAVLGDRVPVFHVYPHINLKVMTARMNLLMKAKHVAPFMII